MEFCQSKKVGTLKTIIAATHWCISDTPACIPLFDGQLMSKESSAIEVRRPPKRVDIVTKFY